MKIKITGKDLKATEAIKEYLETQDEIKQIWSGWRTTVSWFIDQLISMLNSGRHVLQAFVG